MNSPATYAPPSSTDGERRAVIDVGSNSIKLLVGLVTGRTVEPILEIARQTRLGAGLFETGLLSEDAITRTAGAAAELSALARQQGARIRILATAAAREARNQATLIDRLRDATGLETEVISGDREAELAFRGVCTDPRHVHGTRLVTDLGGGSTEFILGREAERVVSRSFPLGAVRWFDRWKPADPPGTDLLGRVREDLDRFLLNEVMPCLREAWKEPGWPTVHVGVGGTAGILARMHLGTDDFDRARIEASRLPASALESLVTALWSESLATRRRRVGLPPERADIILTGAVIHERILRAFGIDALQPSTRGPRFAALLEFP